MQKCLPRRLLKDSLYSKSDIYYRKAKQDCFRARSAYKLLQIDQLFCIFQKAQRVIDLCAAPGSWSQVCSLKLKKLCDNDPKQTRIIAVDLQQMAPIDHVVQLQGDITKRKTVQQILEKFGKQRAGLIISDGAPDVTGMHDIDQYLQSQLLTAALNICLLALQQSGIFVAKIFMGTDKDLIYLQFKAFFQFVEFVKPDSSRQSSSQYFIVCLGFHNNKDCPQLFTFKSQQKQGSLTKIQSFICSGDFSCFDQ